jgi:ubiquinone/menaquinone biosynthesis C-methylase UbiE
MGRLSFENFGHAAAQTDDPTIIASRYLMQKDQEKLITYDVIKKLELTPSDIVLDIGAGPGNITLPLSFMVKEIHAIDHENCLAQIEKRYPSLDNIKLLPGNFLDLEIKETYSKIFFYSVLQYLANEDEVFIAINKAYQALAPGGILMLGDLPNRDKEERFRNSKAGQEYQKKWDQMQ